MWPFLSCSFLLCSCMVTCTCWWTYLREAQNTHLVFWLLRRWCKGKPISERRGAWQPPKTFCINALVPTHTCIHTGTGVRCYLCPSAAPYRLNVFSPGCSIFLYPQIPPQHRDEVSAQLDVTPVDRTNGPKLAGIKRKDDIKKPTTCADKTFTCFCEHTPKITEKQGVIAKSLVQQAKKTDGYLKGISHSGNRPINMHLDSSIKGLQ